MQFNAAVELLWQKLGSHQIMALAASANDQVTVRNVSCIIHERRLFFKTDKNFRKTKMLLENSNVALCAGGVQIEGRAVNLGLVTDEPGLVFQSLYEKYWATSYTAYPHKESEILIEILPGFVEIWDQDERDFGFQILIDFMGQTAERRDYD